MNTISINQRSLLSTIGVDALMIAAACLVPTLSHLTALPLYQANPMLIILLGGMLVVRDRRNAYLMAVLMPLVSCVLVGMPSVEKMVCMIAEYATVMALFGQMSKKLNGTTMKVAAAMLMAMLGGKVVYYLLKAVLVGGLFGTPVALQLVVMLVVALAFALVYNRQNVR